MTSPATPDPGRSQTDVVIDGVKAMIVAGELAPGSRMPVEKDLAARFAVSRGPLREGIRALAVLGVLETRQGDGTYVTSLDPGILLSPLGVLSELQTPATAPQLLGIRRVLEAESVARAALRITDEELARLGAILDDIDAIVEGGDGDGLDAFIEADSEFHHAIAQAADNPALAALIDSLVGRTERARLWRAVVERGAVRATQAEHRAILAELRRREPDRARVRMDAHIMGVEQFAIDHGASSPLAPPPAP